METPYKVIGTPLKNLKHEQFCWEYLKDMHQGNASIRAGYSPNGASVRGNELLKKSKIRDRIQEIIAERAGQSGISAEWVITKLKEVVEKCMQPEPVMVWDNDLKQMVQKQTQDGDYIFEFDAMGANKALELLGRYLGLFEKDNKQQQNVITVNLVGQQNNNAILNIANVDNNASSIESAGDGQYTDRGILTMLPPSTAV